MKVIITGATGMVGEGVLLECLNNNTVEQVLVITRRTIGRKHLKLSELIVPDFMKLSQFSDLIKGYDACFYCAGISSVGLKEEEYSSITYDTTIAFAKALLTANGRMGFCFVSGSHTDGSEKERLMWARVKGKTENALMRLPFEKEFNFRPGAMIPFPEQQNVKFFYKIIVGIISKLSPKRTVHLHELGAAMVNVISNGYPKKVLEIEDIKIAAG